MPFDSRQSPAPNLSTSSPKSHRKPTGLRRHTLTLAIAGALALSLIPTAQAQVFPATIALASLDGTTGFRLDGAASNDVSGYSVSAAGDVNGDGIDDLLIGASGTDTYGTNSGSTYVVFGKSTAFAATLALATLNGTTGFRLDGVAGGDIAGRAVSAAGDVNGDGIDDLLIGAPGATPNGIYSGSSYVLFGKSTAFAATLNLSTLDGTSGFRLDGAASGDRSGRAVSAAGDVNGDGIDDLLIGAYAADFNGNVSGSSYVVFGKTTAFTATLDLSTLNGTTGFRLDGAAADDRSGLALSGAGDVNGDGFDDLLIGAIDADPNGLESGSSYLVFGKSTAFAATLDLSSLDGTNGFRLDGVAFGDNSGRAVSAAGDVNGDGIDDLLIGAYAADPNGGNSGSSYVVFGKGTAFAATLDMSTLDGTTGFRLDGTAAGDNSGRAVSTAGDVNGDGIDDLLIGAYGANSSAGSSYVVFGKSGGFAATLALSTLDGMIGFRLDGVKTDDRSGRALSGAGDVNGDGIDDLLIGALAADPNLGESGSSYVVFGRVPVPAASVTPSSVDFGGVLLGSSSAAQNVSVENTGTADLDIGTLNFSGANAADFGLANDSCSTQTIAPAATCSFDVALSPSALGARSAQLNLPSNAPSSPDALPVMGMGTATDLSIAKTGAPDPVTAGNNLTYTITVTNNGTADSTGGTVTDVLPAGVTFVSSGDCAEAAGTVTCTVGALANGASQTVSFVVAVDAGQTAPIVNTATISANETDLNAANDSAMSATAVAASTDLSITKTGAPDPVTPGNSLIYSMTVTNNGASNSTGGTVTDVLPAGVSFVSSADCTEAAGTVSCAIGALTNGANQMASYVVAVDSAQTAPIVNTATVAANETDPNAGNNTAMSTTAVVASTDLSITKTNSPDPVTAGNNLTYSMTVTNNGISDSTGGTVTDVLPAGVSFVSSADCTEAAGTVSCAIGALTNGANQMVSFVVAVDAGQTAPIMNTATVAANEPDPNAGNDSAMSTTAVVASTDLSITKIGAPDPITAGNNLTYSMTVANNGISDSSGGTVTDVLPAGVSFVSSADCMEAAGTVTCAIGALTNGTNQMVGFVVAVDAGQTAPIINTATISANETDPNAGNDSAMSTTAVVASTDLSITKIGAPDPVTAGTNLIYTLSVTNDGPSDSTGAAVTDVLPAGISFDSSADCTAAAGTVSCAIGALASGANQVVSFVVAVNSAQTADIVNTVSVVANETDPNGANNSATATTAVVASADLAISKDDGVTEAIPGGSVTYAIVVSNAGPSDAPGTTVSDIVPAACTSVTWTCSGADGASCTANGSGNISDVISVPAAGSVSYSAVCSISPAATGSLVNTASVAAAAGVTDPTSANNSATDTDTLTPTADLAISKTDNLTTVQVNAAGSYVITASNAGPSDAPGSTVNDVFPANFTPGAWTCVGATGGACPASGTGNIGTSVNLPTGGSVAFTVAGTYAGTIGIVSNTATVAADAAVTDPNAANNGAVDTTEIASPATLSATKIGIANMTVAGGSLNYVIEISNAGPQNQLDNPGPEMVDILPFGYVYLSAISSSGTLSHDPTTRTLDWSGPVAVGQTISVSINGSIDPAVAGSPISNQATLRFDADGNGSNEATALSDDPSQPGPADATVIGIAEVVPVTMLDRLGLLLTGLMLALSGGLLLRRRG